MRNGRWRRLCGVTVWLVLVGAAGPARAQSGEVGEWRHYGADGANTKYSPLDQITVTNFSDLEVAWRWTSISTEVASQRDSIDPGLFKATPLMVGGLLYVSTPLGQVAALDAGTGEAVWIYDPHSYDRIERPANIGWQHRGVSYWEDDESDDARVVIATHDLRLIAINARTGRLYPDFGENGTVDLSQSLGREIDSSRITHSTPVAVVRDTLVVGSTLEDRTTTREAPPGHVRGFDARTGAMKWIFHTIPQGDEFGVDSWQNGSWRYSGHTNVWGNMPVDEELGYVYLPVTTPTNDWYGGMRPGDNLFAESIVAVDAETGQRMWHFQAVHHGLWDYDFPTGGNLLDITVDGREIKAIAQTSKQAFTYVFDRVTGEPVWPIEERPVTAGTVPGEWYSPTQPFPTKPPAFDLQGITVDDLVDFTPELREEAIRIAERGQLSPIFTPPNVRGEGRPMIQAPGTGGGVNWPGSAVDPETGRLFVPSQTRLRAVELIEYAPPATVGYFTETWAVPVPGPQGLPLVKPPYKRVTAIDLNTGEHAWMSPHGDGPRNHPALKALNLPALGGHSGINAGGPLVTKTLLLVNSGGRYVEDQAEGARSITAYHKDTGDYLGSFMLPSVPYGNPMTYLHEGKQYIVVAVGGGGGVAAPELIALTLP
ncbi:MAG: PQQ-binding-like beta-propeller repeat protein [Vicinamibacterales bacterium]|nr:PQQ-binding-like beta-propeller repeat protein [Vicinamibacterales bacterium]MDP7691112.1 PQQ-binding-like beta-propeller repeat protein [Vicinamibacterales bacterium]HJN42995.1 PQQ-binding-like beta-propeller repeat protein [Vicinamibacterales bacterium]